MPILEKNKLIRELSEAITDAKRFKFKMDSKNWGYSEGMLITYNEAQLFLDLLKKHKPTK